MLMNRNEVPTAKPPYATLSPSVSAVGPIAMSVHLVDMRCVEEEANATVDGTPVPLSDWEEDCSYQTRLSGETVILTTWGLIIEYAGTSITGAKIVPPRDPMVVSRNSTLFAGYQTRSAAEVAYRTYNPGAPIIIPWQEED
jgi:hypothetical protein